MAGLLTARKLPRRIAGANHEADPWENAMERFAAIGWFQHAPPAFATRQLVDPSGDMIIHRIAMSPKQEIYREFLRTTLPYIRNIQSQPFWRRWRDRTVYEEAELIHNLWPHLFEPEFTDHDIWFLNSHAESYFREADFSPLYPQLWPLIRELFALYARGFPLTIAMAQPSRSRYRPTGVIYGHA